MRTNRKLGIIGIGPRGGYALENLIIELNKGNGLDQIHILLFEESGNFGNGQVYNTNQNETNWINISERILLLDRREDLKNGNLEIPSFPSYHEWVGKEFDQLPKTAIDIYPPRSKIGAYLEQRFKTFIEPLLKAKIVSLYKERVKDVVMVSQSKIELTTELKSYPEIDEILLTIGHQPTKLSKQLSEWEAFVSANSTCSLFKSPYPVDAFLMSDKLSTNSIIGIRGFGLAMIDVVRSIADKFGQFGYKDKSIRSCTYQTAHDITNLFIPFSLNGLPPAPKPLNVQIDEWYQPTSDQLTKFEDIIKNIETQKNAKSPLFLIKAFAPIAAAIYLHLPLTYLHEKPTLEELEDVIHRWMLDDTFDHPTILPLKQSAIKTMQDYVGMATGTEAISLDFCIGQVWRHCQRSMYDKLSFNKCSENVFAEIIALDEGIKRYSYGPPVESIQQLIALCEAGVLCLDFVNDPEIELTNTGWNLQKNDAAVTVNMMINSVLDPPKIESVNSSIVENMLSNDLIEAVHDDLGVMTDENGYVTSENINRKPPIALLGRLAKGTIIGVDAILECYGSRPQQWALEAANRHKNWLQTSEAI